MCQLPSPAVEFVKEPNPNWWMWKRAGSWGWHFSCLIHFYTLHFGGKWCFGYAGSYWCQGFFAGTPASSQPNNPDLCQRWRGKLICPLVWVWAWMLVWLSMLIQWWLHLRSLLVRLCVCMCGPFKGLLTCQSHGLHSLIHPDCLMDNKVFIRIQIIHDSHT